MSSLSDGKWSMANGRWPKANGKWSMANGKTHRHLCGSVLAFAVSAALLFETQPAAQQEMLFHALQQPTFQSRVNAVRVDVLVTENDQPVQGLQAADFEVLDNGVRQQIDTLSYNELPLDVVLVLDTSRSVVGPRLEQLRTAGTRLLDNLRNDDHAGLVTFSRVVLMPSGLTTDLGTVRTALSDAAGAGDTSLRDGIFTALTLGQSGTGRSLLIVFSDGIDTASWLTPASVLDVARRSEAVVYGISTASARKVPFLDEICAVTGGSLFQGEWSDALSGMFVQILEEFRRRYVLTYSARGVETGGWHRLTIRVKGRNVKIKARPGYDSGK